MTTIRATRLGRIQAGAPAAKAPEDPYAFEIDENLRVVQVPSEAVVIGVEGTPGADCMSSTGELADGATVLYPLPAAQIIPLGKVELPTLPAPVCNAWVESDVPTECAVRYVRDVNVVIGRLEEKLEAVAGAVSMLDTPTVIPELAE